MASELKRTSRAVKQEMKEIMSLATARSRALDKAVKELSKQGVKGVPKVLSTYGKFLTPEETVLLENATDEVIEKVIETHKLLKGLHSTMDCI